MFCFSHSFRMEFPERDTELSSAGRGNGGSLDISKLHSEFIGD